MINEIGKFRSCNETINLHTQSKQLINDTPWNNLGNPIKVPIVNLNVSNNTCNLIKDEANKTACNIYINKCKLKTLYQKYFPENSDVSINYDITLLNKILERSIMNNNNRDNTDLISFGANLSVIPVGLAFDMEPPLRSLNIPNIITTISNHAFTGNNISSLIIPESVTTIGEGAFEENDLVSVIIPNSVTIIGRNAFSVNPRLTSVKIPRYFQSSINDIFGNSNFNIEYT